MVFTDPTYGLRQPDGSIVGQEYPFPGVFRYSLEKGTLQALVRDFDAPNGLALTADDSKMYICDTRQQIIRVFDVAPDGVLSNSRVFCEAKHGDASGRPDGMKLDSLGNVYLAANSPEGIWVFDPDGKLLGFIGVGESPANLAWGGDDWQTHVRHRPDLRLPPAHEGPRPARPLRPTLMAVIALDDRLHDLVDFDVRVDQVATGFVFTEGPLWDQREPLSRCSATPHRHHAPLVRRRR